MADKEWLDPQHYRLASPDGRRTYLFMVNPAGAAHPDICLEIVENPRRTTPTLPATPALPTA